MNGGRIGRAGFAAFVFLSGQAWGLTIAVAPDGSDAGDGSPKAPLATMEGARARVRTLRAEAGAPVAVDVVFAEGAYPLDRKSVV